MQPFKFDGQATIKKPILCAGMALAFVALYALPGPSDHEHMLHIEQLKKEQADRIQAQIRTNEAYRDFYTLNPTGGGYVSRSSF